MPSKHSTEPEDAPVAKRTRMSDEEGSLAPPFKEAAKNASDGNADVKREDTKVGGEDKVQQEQEEAEGGEATTTTTPKNGGSKSKAGTAEQTSGSADKKASSSGGNKGAVSPGGRDGPPPPNLLEKGIIYFFFRSRVKDAAEADAGDPEADAPSDASDVARTHLVLRPIEADASLRTEGGDLTVGDAGNARLLALPKKLLPRSGRDRFLAIVEKGGVDFATLKRTFLDGGDRETATVGTRHDPAAAPFAEGVYAMVRTGRETHLAYVVTLPRELGEVQNEMGLKDRGSFILSTKSPKNDDGPPNARFGAKPEYPGEVLEEFRDLRWLPTQPKHLDYPNTQLLLIGESSGPDKALEPQKGAVDGEKPLEELEELEHEDTKRMEHLAGDDSDAIFADLQVRATEYPELKTTF